MSRKYQILLVFVLIGLGYIGFNLWKHTMGLSTDHRTAIGTVKKILFAPKAGKEIWSTFYINGIEYNVYTPINSFENEFKCTVTPGCKHYAWYSPSRPAVNKAILDSGIIFPNNIKCP